MSNNGVIYRQIYQTKHLSPDHFVSFIFQNTSLNSILLNSKCNEHSKIKCKDLHSLPTKKSKQNFFLIEVSFKKIIYSLCSAGSVSYHHLQNT